MNAHLIDLRNHGESDHFTESMSYIEMAHDLKRHLEEIQILDSGITLIGHNMGSKVAMTFSLIPEL